MLLAIFLARLFALLETEAVLLEKLQVAVKHRGPKPLRPSGTDLCE
jgi:hypothetical protein